MRSFSTITLIATLAFSAFTSAAPSPAVSDAVVDIGARTESCVGRCIFDTMHDQINDHANAIRGYKEMNHDNAQAIFDSFNEIKVIIVNVHTSFKRDCTQLIGLGGAEICGILAVLLNLIAEIVLIVVGLLSGLASTDPFCILLNPCIQDLLCEVAYLVNTVLCLVCGLLGGLLGVGGLLGGLLGLVGGILGPALGLVLHICLPILGPLLVQLSGALTPGCGTIFQLFPVAGAILFKGIVSVSTGSPDAYFGPLFGGLSL
ncbi:hypothetical protein C8J56DRAFT_1160035 [Mycena floridula]|nr:hypothetical protein C8J56DRAFT_1160035 [Mycena floridula]